MQTNHHMGLTAAEVAASRERHGRNVLTPPAKTPLWRKFLGKFNDALIIILLVAGLLSVGISCYEYFGLHEGARVWFEPVGIFIAILLATGLSFIFETKAEREFEVLNRVADEEPVQVMRDGRPCMVPKSDVVVGDIVFLATGQEIPADGTLLEAVAMSVDESSLTGEPICCKTTDERLFDSEATYASNMVLRGTKVMEGHGVMRVASVGDHTENGKVHTEAQIDDGKRTPLDQQFDRLGRVIAWNSYAIGGLIVVGRIVVWFALHNEADSGLTDLITYLLQSLMIAVTLVVCSVPEGLPMAVTLSLAYSMRRMLKTNNLVRKMHACETMGATTVICTDKTGTLTQNRMRVMEVVEGGCATLNGVENCSPILYECMACNSTAMLDADGQPIGNPTEGALLLWLKERGQDYSTLRQGARRIAEEPFNTERKYMSVTVMSAVTGKETRYVKGAPEIVAQMCGCEVPAVVAEWQAKAMRTLAFAVDGQWLACCAISDPVREDVPAAVAECRGAGIEIKIVTGDTPGTAREIARQIALLSPGEADNQESMQSKIITGPEFAALSDDELTERVADIRIIARARPMDKKRLVEALQRRGEVVAVTGDGTNDAPALKAAHVGLSMGDGTAVAKEASDITIIDNSFASIGRAVMWGRSLYQNIQRFIMFQMTINVVACLVVLAGAFMDTTSPLSVTQMLWVNLIMDTFAAMALASLPPNEAVMGDRPRSRKAFIINLPMIKNIVGVGFLFAALLILLLYRMEHVESTDIIDLFTASATGHCHPSRHELTIFFTIFVMLQFWNMFNARAFATGSSALHLHGCRWFVIIASLILFGQIAIVELVPDFFGVEPLRLYEWLIIILATSPVLLIGELLRIRTGVNGSK